MAEAESRGHTEAPADQRRLLRRMAFADNARHAIDRALAAISRRRRMDDFQWSYYVSVVLYDLIEGLLAGGRFDRIGRASLAALSAPIRLKQDPRYRAYWYDPDRHAMVGALLGLDLHHHQGKFYVLESNLTAGLMPERRSLYPEALDPFITRIVDLGKRQGFRKVVFYRRSWRAEHLREFEVAASRYGVAVEAATAMRETGDPEVNPVNGLPVELEQDTLYVVCTAVSDSAIFPFLHQKAQLDVWLPAAIAEAGEPPSRVAAVPSSSEPWLPPLDPDPRWPNIVAKLSSSDEGKDVVMGRFTSTRALYRALGLSETGKGLPRPFLRSIASRIIAFFIPDALSVVYQAFIPPEIEAELPCMIRMECFVSPLGDLQLSAHATVGAEPLPASIPTDVILERSPFEISVPPGRFRRLDPTIERELDDVAREFGSLLRSAMHRKFLIRPDDALQADARITSVSAQCAK